MTSAIIIDTETAGFDEPQVIQMAWMGYPSELEIVHERHYQPSKAIEWGALATHHILPGSLVGMPPHTQAAVDAPKVDYWIGHGIDYDWGALGQPNVKRICTLAMCRHLWPEVDSHKLGAMMYFLSADHAAARELLRSAHDAAADVMFCATVLKAICGVAKLDPLDLPRLWFFSEDARVPRIMTFGKFKGQPISAVDRGYMNWYARQPDTDPYVLEAFKRNGF